MRDVSTGWTFEDTVMSYNGSPVCLSLWASEEKAHLIQPQKQGHSKQSRTLQKQHALAASLLTNPAQKTALTGLALVVMFQSLSGPLPVGPLLLNMLVNTSMENKGRLGMNVSHFSSGSRIGDIPPMRAGATVNPDGSTSRLGEFLK